MHRLLKTFVAFCVLGAAACVHTESLTTIPRSQAESLTGYFYIPLDPLPVSPDFSKCSSEKSRVPRVSELLQLLPDNAVRVAVRILSGKASVRFAGNEIGVEGNSYQVILDYINVDVTNIPFTGSQEIRKIDGSEPGKVLWIGEPVPEGWQTESYNVQRNPIKDPVVFTLPVYVGIGLRLTASVTVRKGSVNLASLGAIAAAAEAHLVSGTLLVQTLGITGPKVSSALPLPSELNPTTVQNAILALGTIKSGLYSNDSVINARVIGLYNTSGVVDPRFVNTVISELAKTPIPWDPCEHQRALAVEP